MTEPTPQKIMELYNLMEEKLEEMEMDFDQFSVLYKSFRDKIPVETEEGRDSCEPLPLGEVCRLW